MLINSKNNNDRGFTLIEMAVVLLIIGIIAAIAAPSFIGLLNRMRVNRALSNLVGAIKETQRQAMSKSMVCRININTSTNVLSGSPDGCLLNNRQIIDEINIRTNIPGVIPNISFSHKGSTTKMGTIVVSDENTNLQKCFVISLGIGIIRTGDYTGRKTERASHKKCTGNK